MKLVDYLKAVGVGMEVLTEFEVDQAQLAAGEDITVNVQVGSEQGKPVHLRGVLTTK